MKQLTTIAKLIEVRDSMKAVHREDWSEHMETYGAIIRALMAKSGVHNHVAAAIMLSQDAANEGHPMIALLFLAVGVELSENDQAQRRLVRRLDAVEPSNLWLHMANTHDIVLTSTEENDIKSAALDDYDAERIKWGNRIMRLEGDAAGDRALREDADKRAEVLREALIELVLVTQALGELEIPGAKDAEDVDHILCVGDCRRIAQAVAKAKTILEDSAP